MKLVALDLKQNTSPQIPVFMTTFLSFIPSALKSVVRCLQ